MSNPQTAARAVMLAGALALGLQGCAWHRPTLHWPWGHRTAPAPQPVSELAIEGEGILQYWDRNALQLDMTGVAGSGQAVLRAPRGWPVRLEFKVRPGTFGRLDVLGRQRVVFEVPSQGQPALLRLSPAAYAADTPQITVRWSAADGSGH